MLEREYVNILKLNSKCIEETLILRVNSKTLKYETKEFPRSVPQRNDNQEGSDGEIDFIYRLVSQYDAMIVQYKFDEDLSGISQRKTATA